ncbi:MAG: hypothetical protein RIC95_15235 [Vicingaceae bacterium]
MKKLSKWSLQVLKLYGLIWLFIGAFSSSLQAQNQTVSLNHQFYIPLEQQLLENEQRLHFSFKPLLQRDLKLTEAQQQNLLPYLQLKRQTDKSFVSRKFFHEHLIQLDTNQIVLTLDPLLNLQFGFEEREDPREIDLYKNMRGFRLRLDLGDKISVLSSFRENQANLPLYLSRRTQASSVAYGQGRVKRFNDGFDFNMASSRLVYQASDRFTFQFGSDKHFIGNGYRSFLLSDLSFNYPFFRIQSNWWKGKLKYENLFTLFQDLDRINSNGNGEGLFERKQAAFHFLSYAPSQKLNLSLFEGTIFPSLDSGGNIPVGANYYVPLIFLNSLIEGDGQKGNSRQGINFSYQLVKKVLFYGQLAMNDFEVDQLSTQLGGKWFVSDALTFQAEFNARTNQNNTSLFHHYNESLTHPVSGDFQELLGAVYWSKGRFMSRLIGNYIQQEQTEIAFLDARQSYLVNTANNLTFSIGLQYRDTNTPITFQTPQQNSLHIYIGLSTNFQNLYFNY